MFVIRAPAALAVPAFLAVLLAATCRKGGEVNRMSWFNGADAALEKAIDADSDADVAAAIRKSANPNARGKNGITPLEYAVGQFRKKAFQALLRAGADPARRDDEQENAITIAASAYAQDPDYLTLAIRAGGDPNTRRPDGDPILVRFINDRNLPAISEMKRLGADLDLRTRSDEPLVIYAGLLEYWDVVWRLLKEGAKFDYADEPMTWKEIFCCPWVTPPDSPLWPEKARTRKFLEEHGVLLPAEAPKQ